MNPLSAVQIANVARLKRRNPYDAIWVVEGQQDKIFCEKFVEAEGCTIQVAGGKSNVCEVVEILDNDICHRSVGLVDANFDYIEKREIENPNIFSTDLHDLECMLIWAIGLKEILREYGSEKKIQEFGKDVQEAVFLAACPIGCLRLYSERKDINLRFRGLNYGKIIDRKTLKINRKEMVREIKNLSRRPDLSIDALLDGIGAIESQAYDLWQICSGTDVLGILSFGLRAALGTNSVGNVRENNLRRVLRVAYQSEHFSKTELYRQIRVWESDNAPFRILSE